MADVKISLRKRGASDFSNGDRLLPVTKTAYVLDLLDTNDKISASWLPGWLLGDIALKGTIDLSSGMDIENVMNTYIATTPTTANIGDYVIVGTGGDLDNTTGDSAHHSIQAPGDEGDTTFPVTLEAGDRIILTAVDTLDYTWSFVSQSYNTASTSAPGIVQLVNALDGATGSTTKAPTISAVESFYSTYSAHTHGNINFDGQITLTTPLQDGDTLLFANNSDSNAVIRSSTALNVTTHGDEYLRKDGVWGTPINTWTANAVGTAGYVPAPSASDDYKVYQLDADGNPAWRSLLAYGTITPATGDWILLADQTGNPNQVGKGPALNGNSGDYLDGTGSFTTLPVLAENTTGMVTAPGGVTNKVLRTDITGAVAWGDQTWGTKTISTGDALMMVETTGYTAGYNVSLAFNTGDTATWLDHSGTWSAPTYDEVGADPWGQGMQYYTSIATANGAGHPANAIIILTE